MSEAHKPLLRWARLKQAAKAGARSEGDSVGADPLLGSTAGEVPFDLTSLPSIESIAADTDIIAFLRVGVPAELTRSALRKAWTSDPAIRDFVGIAENQWDFNDPNGIPGFGPLPAESGMDVLGQMSTRLEHVPGPSKELIAIVEPPHVNTDEQRRDEEVTTSKSCLDDPGAVPEENREASTSGTTGSNRRHGSALPR